MTEISSPWNGTTTGDASGVAPYDAPTEFAEILDAVSGGAGMANRGGVITSALNELAVTGTASPVAVASGKAINYGTYYHNSASVNVAIPTPSASTRVDLIVLSKDWSAQTIRITRVAGTEGAGAPSLVQNAGVEWQIPLAEASITTGGVITVTDTREFIGSSSGGITLIPQWFAAADFSPPASNFPDWQNYVGLTNWPSKFVWAFDQATDESIFTDWFIPTGAPLTTVTLKIVYLFDAINTGAVKWNATHIPRAHDEALDAAGVTDTATQTIPGTAKDVGIATITLDASAWQAGEFLQLAIIRDANDAADTAAADALFIGAQLELA